MRLFRTNVAPSVPSAGARSLRVSVAAFSLAMLSAGILSMALFAPKSVDAAATTVREPAWGIPHIYADTDLELAYENGREISKDRLGQLILFARSGRGTLGQAFGLLDPGFVDDDIEARRSAYTSSELNSMYEKFPARYRDAVNAYCDGVNDTIEDIYAGNLPSPIEVSILGSLGLTDDLFGNATNISDQVDPNYKAPGGADPSRPLAGYQYTPELVMAVAVLQVRNFGGQSFGEDRRFGELQSLIDVHGSTTGTEIWRDLNFINDPLAPVTLPNATSPGYGGPLARNATAADGEFAVVRAASAGTSGADPADSEIDSEVDSESDATVEAATEATTGVPMGAATDAAIDAQLEDGVMATASALVEDAELEFSAPDFPAYDYVSAKQARTEAHETRAARASKWGAWPKLGSYSWMIAGNRSATGKPWIGGFPQMGILTPSIMHFVENRSGENIKAMGMELISGPVTLIGHNDTVAYTSTTAQLRVSDTFFEEIVSEDSDTLRYSDEGSPAPLSMRVDTFFVNSLGVTTTRVFWRTHERGGNGGDRPVADFLGDDEGTATGGSATTLVDSAASFGAGYVGGHVAIVDGAGAGQIRAVSAVPDAMTLTVTVPWAVTPDATSVYVAAQSGGDIVAVTEDFAFWLEESTTILGWLQMQEAEDVMDVRLGARIMPSTHNFPAADNLAFNGIGTDGTGGNIAYYSGGFPRKRQDATDKMLPLDGTGPHPLTVISGTVTSATATTVTATGAFTGETLDAAALNFRYDNPALQGSEYIISIIAGTGARQTRRIATNDNDTVTVEFEWGVTPAPGDLFEIEEITAMPEAINPSEGYMANWNNRAAVSDDSENFGRTQRVAFILERLAASAAWTRDDQRQLNKDVAGLTGNGVIGRYIVPRLRQAVDAVGNGGNPDVDTVLAQLEAHNGAPVFGRYFADPVFDTTRAGEIAFLNSLISELVNDIYGDEFSGALSAPGGSRALALVNHAIDSAAGDVPGSYTQEYAGDYFNGGGWETVVRDAFSALASGGIPADSPRPGDNYAHPLAALFPELVFTATPAGNRGTWEQIVEVDDPIKGEFMFPLGQSGLIEGSLVGVTSIDPNADSLSPLWRDWRFLPMLHVGEDLAASGSPDNDGDGVWDAFERWYFASTALDADDDSDKDKSSLADEFAAGSDPTDKDTDDDGISDGPDRAPQDRLPYGFIKLKAEFRTDPDKVDRDTFKLKGSGRIAATFDPDNEDATLTVEDADGVLYTVTIPAGTMENKDDVKFSYKDKEGTLDNLGALSVKIGKPGKFSKVAVKTVKTDFSGLDVATTREVTVTLIAGTTASFEDARDWTQAKTDRLSAMK